MAESNGQPSAQPQAPTKEFEYISEEADQVLEIIFEHPDGITEAQLADSFGVFDAAFLVDQLRRAGIVVRVVERGQMTYFLPPLRVR